jgi:hypothetical protein
VNVQQQHEDKEVDNRNLEEASSSSVPAPAPAPKALGPKLTTSQLYDLYQRLDINGDGELDMQEFLAVGKKLNFTDETLIVKVFYFIFLFLFLFFFSFHIQKLFFKLYILKLK